MTELRRPAPTTTTADELRRRCAATRERLQWPQRRPKSVLLDIGSANIDIGGNDGIDVDPGPPHEPDQPSLLVVAVGLVVVIVLGSGLLWGWQTWSQRSSEPIDDLLPMLTTVEQQDQAAAPTPLTPDTLAPDSLNTESLASESRAPDSLAPESRASESLAPESGAELVVHVSGAVVEPGIVHLPAGSRVFEAVRLAGGADTEADLDRINLAAVMADGERIHVPAIGEEINPFVASGAEAGNDSNSQPQPSIDLNEATALQFQQLPGVGPSIAAAIVGVRDERGPFLTVDELVDVPGIGAAKLELLRPLVHIDG